MRFPVSGDESTKNPCRKYIGPSHIPLNNGNHSESVLCATFHRKTTASRTGTAVHHCRQRPRRGSFRLSAAASIVRRYDIGRHNFAASTDNRPNGGDAAGDTSRVSAEAERFAVRQSRYHRDRKSDGGPSMRLADGVQLVVIVIQEDARGVSGRRQIARIHRWQSDRVDTDGQSD